MKGQFFQTNVPHFGVQLLTHLDKAISAFLSHQLWKKLKSVDGFGCSGTEMTAYHYFPFPLSEKTKDMKEARVPYIIFI